MRIRNTTPIKHAVTSAAVVAFFAFIAVLGFARQRGMTRPFDIALTWAGIGGLMGYTATMAFSTDRPDRAEIIQINPSESTPARYPNRVMVTHRKPGVYLHGEFVDYPENVEPVKVTGWADAVLQGRATTTFGSMESMMTRTEATAVRAWLVSGGYARELGDRQITLNRAGEDLLAAIAGYQHPYPTNQINVQNY